MTRSSKETALALGALGIALILAAIIIRMYLPDWEGAYGYSSTLQAFSMLLTLGGISIFSALMVAADDSDAKISVLDASSF